MRNVCVVYTVTYITHVEYTANSSIKGTAIFRLQAGGAQDQRGLCLIKNDKIE